MTAVYIPQAGSIAARALAHFQAQPPDTELPSGVLADALEVASNIINVCLDTATKHGLFTRDKREGRVYWRLGRGAPSAAPPPDPAVHADPDDGADDDAEPIARVIPSTAVAPIPGLERQSWCPVAQAIGDESSQDDPVASPPPRTPAPPIAGLGWKAPGSIRASVMEAGTSAESSAPAAATDNAGTAVEPPPSMPAWLDGLDPDFREVNGSREPSAPAFTALPAVPQPSADEFRCALWSNGRLHIELYPGNFMLLTKAETQHLLRYVGDVLSARARAGA